jgi:hypothetical protein
MSKFDVWINGDNLQAEKVKAPRDSNVHGWVYLTTLNGSTKKNILAQVKTRLQSGLLKIPKQRENVLFSSPKKDASQSALPTSKTHEVKKRIYCDFNGVLDDREREEKVSRNDRPAFRLPKVSCPHKIFRLIKLAVKHDAKIIMTSLHRQSVGSYAAIIPRCLVNCEIDEYIKFYEENKSKIKKLTRTSPTPVIGKRTDEVRLHVIENECTHFVVFEDDHPIDSDLNPVMIDWCTGLEASHIELADLILGKE